MKNINLGELSLNVVDQGVGQPLLLIHGFPLDHTMWQFQIEDLSRDFRIIAPDLRGFGSSDLNDNPMSMAQFADDLERLLTALGMDSPVSVLRPFHGRLHCLGILAPSPTTFKSLDPL